VAEASEAGIVLRGSLTALFGLLQEEKIKPLIA
jgi:hypothetical protein